MPDLEQIDSLLSALTEQRRAHSLGVGRKAELAQQLAPTHLREAVVTAAYLHDVGYGHVETGFHPIDGAMLLEELGYAPEVCHLVAYHSASVVEAHVRGLDPRIFDRFTVVNDGLDTALDVLWWADMTTGPTGESLTVDERLAEIRSRYGPDDLVTTSIDRAEPLLVAAVHRVEGSM